MQQQCVMDSYCEALARDEAEDLECKQEALERAERPELPEPYQDGEVPSTPDMQSARTPSLDTLL
eukprot:14435263-Alexandrium_andersonii.AAC.1